MNCAEIFVIRSCRSILQSTQPRRQYMRGPAGSWRGPFHINSEVGWLARKPVLETVSSLLYWITLNGKDSSEIGLSADLLPLRWQIIHKSSIANCSNDIEYKKWTSIPPFSEIIPPLSFSVVGFSSSMGLCLKLDTLDKGYVGELSVSEQRVIEFIVLKKAN